MANDPSSAGNGRFPVGHPQHTPDAASQGSEPAVTQGQSAQNPSAALGQFPSQLTQELAQLLAASIAQQGGLPQPSARGLSPGQPAGSSTAMAAGTPTGGELASLAAIMAGAQTARKPLPRFQDELSTLNYSRMQVPPPAPLRQISDGYPHHEASGQNDAHDDEPMPIPSTWRQPAAHDEDRPFAKQLGAAAMGLAAGLVVVVPAVLWMTGYIGSLRPRTDMAATEQRNGEIKTVKVRPLERLTDNAGVFSSDATANAPSPLEAQTLTTASMTKVPSLDPAQHIEHLLVQARQRIDGGDVMSARDILAGETAPSAPVLFALAETYDPNMLAAWGSRGISADVQRARSLYAKSLDLGYGRALPRLEALK